MKIKYLILTTIILSIFFLSFNEQDDVGKEIFNNNCAACHLPNKATSIAPPFQNIRKDYGLKWTIAFLRNSRELMQKGDINVLYDYYFFNKYEHVKFPVLEAKYITKVLNYVDKFPIDTTQYEHRFTSYDQKQKFVHEHLLKDTIKPVSNFVDTLKTNDSIDLGDTIPTERIRRRKPNRD